MKEYAKDFYKSAAWKRARQTVIKRANGLCERCRAAGLYRPGVIVHHKDYITPENIHNPGVTLSLDNLEYLCEDCHNKEHKAKPNNRYRFDSDGKLLPPKGEERRTTPPRWIDFGRPHKNRGRYFKKTPQGRTHMRGGQNMAEETKSNEKKAKKRTNKLTNARIKKEIEFLTPMFAGIDDEDKKSLVNSLVEEAAFLKVACFQAKEELKKEGLTTETVNASQKFVKAHPSATIYEKYSRQYTAIIHTLIEYLPPKEKKNISRLAALRNG